MSPISDTGGLEHELGHPDILIFIFHLHTLMSQVRSSILVNIFQLLPWQDHVGNAGHARKLSQRTIVFMCINII